MRDLALFNIAIDSKLRGCDVVNLKVEDIAQSGYAASRATIRQKKTGHPVRFEITEQARLAVDAYLRATPRKPGDYLLTSRNGEGQRLSTRQYAQAVSNWVALIGLNPSSYGTHSLRRTKATLIYRKTGNLRAVQLLLGHTKIESMVHYLGVEVDDALAIAEIGAAFARESHRALRARAGADTGCAAAVVCAAWATTAGEFPNFQYAPLACASNSALDFALPRLRGAF